MSHRFSRRWRRISSVQSPSNSSKNRPRPSSRQESTFAKISSCSHTQDTALSFGCLHIRQFPIWAARYRNSHCKSGPLLIHHRGKVLAACPSCTLRGVREGWTLTRARSLCTDAKVVAFDPAKVDDVWQEVLRFLYDLTPRLESPQPGLVFFEAPARASSNWLATMAALQKYVREWNAHFGSAQAAVASDRAVAELAAHVVKPGTLQTVRPHYTATFLQQVSSRFLMRLGLSEYTSERLQWFGLRTVKDLCVLSREQIACQFHHAASPHDAELLWRFSRAGSAEADRTPLQSYQLPAVRTARFAFEQAATSPAEWETALRDVIHQATSQLNGLVVGAVRVVIDTKGVSIHCNKLLRESTSAPRTLFQVARELMLSQLGLQCKENCYGDLQVQAIEITLARLTGNGTQSALFDDRHFKTPEQRSPSRSIRAKQKSNISPYPSRLIKAVRNIESRYPQSMFRFKQRDAYAALPEDRDCMVPAIALR